MKLSKRRSAKRSYRKTIKPSHRKKASPAKRISHRKKASPAKRMSHRKKASPAKRMSHRKKKASGRRTRLSFRFGDEIDPKTVTELSVRRAENLIKTRRNLVGPRIAIERREHIHDRLEAIKNKYFLEHLPSLVNHRVYGNDAIDYVSEKLHITPARLIRLIPTVSDLEYEEVTVDKIRLLLLAYYAQETHSYIDSFDK